MYPPSSHPMVYLSIFSCKSCKVAVNDHQINHQSSYSLMTITETRVVTCGVPGITRQSRVTAAWVTCHQTGFFTNMRFVANLYYGQQICWKTFPLYLRFSTLEFCFPRIIFLDTCWKLIAVSIRKYSLSNRFLNL